MDSGEAKRAVDRASHHHERNKSRRLSGPLLAAIEEDMLPRSFEPFLRRVVAEEIDRVLCSNLPMQWRGHNNAFNSLPLITYGVPQQQSSSSTRKLHLHFMSSPAAESTFTHTNLEGECSDTIRVRLIDVTTGKLVSEGLASDAELEVVPLYGDFNIPDEEDWTAEVFEGHVAKEREGKAHLLAGQLKVRLKGGLGTLGQLQFTDNSSWTRSKKFRLGIRVAQDNGAGLARIREGKSQAFSVKECRGKGSQKHDIPSPNDQVWRLRNIAKDGPNHKNLTRHGIHTVQDFLLWVQTQPENLKEVLGNMHAKAYEEAIKHAKRCILGDRMYVYPVNQPPYEKVIFNQNYLTVGAVAHGQYVGLDTLNDSEKVQVDALVKSAYNNWGTEITECMVGDAASAEEPLVDIDTSTETAPPEGFNATDVVQDVLEPLPGSHVHAPDDDFINNALAEEQHNRIEPIMTPATWDFDNSGMISDFLWTGGICSNVDVDGEGWSSDDIAQHVNKVVNEILCEDVNGGPLVQPPTSQASRCWLRIRAVVRCALFIRNARFIQQQQPPDYQNI